MHARDSSEKGGPRWRVALVLLAVLAAAAAVRLLPWSRVFTPGGVVLMADGDTYYHALRAERMARDWPHVPWLDPGMNFPYGADIPWPPLLDGVVAAATVATGPVTDGRVAAIAAVVPVIFGVLLVAAIAGVGALLLRGGPWWDAALLVALLPAAVRQSFVGRADHHVLEVLLSALAFLAYAAALRRARPAWLWPLLLGATLALAFWNWSGSALYLLLLSAHLAVLHLASPADDPAPATAARALALGALTGAALLAVTIAAWGPPGALRSGRFTPIGGLAVAMTALTAVAAGAVAAARRWDPGAGSGRRLLHLVLASALPLVFLAIGPATFRSGATHGLTALGAASAWYSSIGEFWPLLGSGRQPLTTEVLLALLGYGLTLLTLPVAAWLLARAWRREPEERPLLAFLAVWTLGMVLLALLRRRFEGYAVVPVAICAAWTARALGEAVRDRAESAWLAPAARLAALLLLAAPGFPVVFTGAVAELPDGAADKFPLLKLLRQVPAQPDREGVLAAWSHGHEIQWLARKPVVATPFGTDIDPRALRDEAAFFLAQDPREAESLLRARRIGFLLLENPVRETATLRGLVPGSPELAIEEWSADAGVRYAMRPDFFDTVASRLFFADGTVRSGEPSALGTYRLLAESPSQVQVLDRAASRYKLFGVVPGAELRVRGAARGAEVSATVPVRTDLGRTFAWTTRAVAGPTGEAALRVPYATGWNVLVAAGAYRVGDGRRFQDVRVTEAQVEGGQAVAVDLGGP